MMRSASPIILYDVPARTALRPGRRHRQAAGGAAAHRRPEDATGEIARVARLRRRLGADFLLLSGDDASQAAFRMRRRRRLHLGDGQCRAAHSRAALHHACDERLAGRFPVLRPDPGAAARGPVPRGQPDPAQERAQPAPPDGRRPAPAADAAHPRCPTGSSSTSCRPPCRWRRKRRRASPHAAPDAAARLTGRRSPPTKPTTIASRCHDDQASVLKVRIYSRQGAGAT